MENSVNSNAPLPFREKAINILELEILSERLKLIAVSEHFTDAIFQEFTPEIVRYMIPAYTGNREDTKNFITSSQKNMSAGSEFAAAITDKETGEFYGCAGLHGRKNPKKPELGIWLKKSAHGNAYGLETIGALIAWANEHLVCECFQYPVDRANIPSRRIPEHFGGKIVSEKLCPTMDPNKFLDEIIFEIPFGAKI